MKKQGEAKDMKNRRKNKHTGGYKEKEGNTGRTWEIQGKQGEKKEKKRITWRPWRIQGERAVFLNDCQFPSYSLA